MNKEILKAFRQENTYECVADRPNMQACSAFEEGEFVDVVGIGRRYCYIKTLTLSAKFVSNKVQLSDFSKDAEKLILRDLYSGLLEYTSRLRVAIHNQDDDAAMALIQDMEDAYIKGE